MIEVLAIFIGIIGLLCVLGYLVFCIATFGVVIFEYLPEHKDGFVPKLLVFLGLILGIALTLYGLGVGCEAGVEVFDTIRPEGFVITLVIGIVMWVWMFRCNIYDKIAKKKKLKQNQKEKLKQSQDDSIKRSVRAYTNDYRRY